MGLQLKNIEIKNISNAFAENPIIECMSSLYNIYNILV